MAKKKLKINYKILIFSVVLGTIITFFTYNINRKVIKEEPGEITIGSTYVTEMGWPLPYYEEEAFDYYFLNKPKLVINTSLKKLALMPPLKKDEYKTPLECIVDMSCIKNSLPKINWLNLAIDIIFFSGIVYLLLYLGKKYFK